MFQPRLFQFFFIISLFATLAVQADSKTKQQFKNQLQSQQYIGQSLSRADGFNGTVSSNISNWEQGSDPKWYGGNNVLSASWAFVEDFIANLGFHDFPSTFLDCFDFDWGGFCYRRIGFIRIPVGFRVTYRWPMQQVLSRRFFQNRYIPDFYYSLLKASGYHENIWNPLAQEVHAPLAMLNASVQSAARLNTQSYAAYIPAHGVIIPEVNFTPGNIDLSGPMERARLDGGKLGEGDMNQLEYWIGPTLLQSAWTVISNYFPLLKLLPCRPPSQIPIPLGSEDPAIIDITRNPFMGFIFYRDTGLRSDLTDWLKNPAVCSEWMSHVNRQNVPRDLMKFDGTILTNPLGFLIDELNDITDDGSINASGGLIAPLPNSAIARLDRMCTRNWGASVPFATTHQVHDTGFIDAGKNFEKAIRLGVGAYKTFIQTTSLRNYIRFYELRKDKDAYQLTYNDEWRCKSVGTPAKPFPGANTYSKAAEHGLFSMTHWWRLPECCMRFGRFFEFLGGMGGFGGFQLPDPNQILGQINQSPFPNMHDVLNLPSTINIPNIPEVPDMPTSFDLPDIDTSGVPDIPGLF